MEIVIKAKQKFNPSSPSCIGVTPFFPTTNTSSKSWTQDDTRHAHLHSSMKHQQLVVAPMIAKFLGGNQSI